MTGHLLTMHTNDDKDRLWLTCDCGWEGPVYPVSPDDKPSQLALLAVDEANRHIREVSP